MALETLPTTNSETILALSELALSEARRSPNKTASFYVNGVRVEISLPRELIKPKEES